MNYLDIALFVINIVVLIVNLFMITKFIINNNSIISLNNKDSDYIEKINYYKKINIKDILTYLILFTLYLILISSNIIYINIFFIIIGIYLIVNTPIKINKFKILSSKLYKSISILKIKPGIRYYFDFYRDILMTKTNFILGIILIITIITSYLFSNSLNSIFAVNLFLVYIYMLLRDKKTLIVACYSSFEELLDDKKYTKLKKITVRNIITKKVLDFKYYNILIDNKYLSPLLMYDPELYLEEVEVYINNTTGKGLVFISNLYKQP